MDGPLAVLSVTPLRADQVDAAYPLMHSAMPALTLAAWRSYAARIAAAEDGDDRFGVMVAKAPNGTLRGAFVFTIGCEDGDANTLMVTSLLIPPLGRHIVVNALGEAIRQLAEQRSCSSVTVELPPDADWKMPYFTRLGFQVSICPTSTTLLPPAH